MEEEQPGEGVMEVKQPVEEEEEVVRVEIPNVNVVSHVSEGL